MNPIHQYPFNFGRDGGGSFIATATSPDYTGHPIGSLIKSYYWHNAQYALLVTAIILQSNVVATSTPGWVKLGFKKATGITVPNSGGTLITEYATPRRSNMMSNDELVTYLEVRNAEADTGLTKGTRTLSQNILQSSFYSKNIGIGTVTVAQELLIAQGDPVFLENGEGLELSFDEAELSGLSMNIVSTLRFIVLPVEVIKDFF